MVAPPDTPDDAGGPIDPATRPVLRVAIDATPLIGLRTGVGRFTHEVISRFPAHPGLALHPYGLTWRGRHALATELPPGARRLARPMPARPLRALWAHLDHPRIEWWTGAVDVVHGTNFVVPPARAARVVSVHDLTVLHHPEMCAPATLAYPDLLRRAIRTGAWVHTISAMEADVVRELGARPERVVSVPNGVPPVAAAAPGEGAVLAGGGRYILALGTIEPRKGFPLLVEAFDRLARSDPELRLVIAGPDGWGTEELRSALGTSPHRARIRRLGWVTERERAGLLRDASVLAFPSYYEGFGFPPLEAMVAGTPVVATAVGGIPDTVGDAGRLVAPGRADALAEGIYDVLGDDALAADLVARGRRNLRRFSWDATAAGLVELYRRAAGFLATPR